MGVETKNVIIDHAEIPNAGTTPARPDYRKPEYTPAKRRSNNTLTIMGIVFAALAGVLLLYYGVRAGEYVSTLNGYVSDEDIQLWVWLKRTFVGVLIVAMISSIVWIILAMLRFAAIRLQNDYPVLIIDLLRRTFRSAGLQSIDQYYDERRAWANNSMYWNLSTLDQSSATTHGPRLPDTTPPAQLTIANQLPLQSNSGTIEQLIRMGLIGRSGNSILLGFSNPDKPVYAELVETGFIGLAGMPRVGKSSAAVFYISQLMLYPKAQIIVCDKHAKRPDSLMGMLGPVQQRLDRVASTIEEIETAIDYWYQIGVDRLADTTTSYPPLLLVIDEFTGMILLEQLSNSSLSRLISGSVEFPKVQAHGLLIGHSWTGKLLGGTYGAPMRRALTQRVILRIDPQDAEFLVPRAFAKNTLGLPIGKALYLGASSPSPIELAVPHVQDHDLRYLAGVLPGDYGASVASVADVSSPLLGDLASTGTIDTSEIDSTDTESIGKLNHARDLLQKQRPDGTHIYSIRVVQALTNLRTATVIQLAHEIGRKRD